MFNHTDLIGMQSASLKLQRFIRKQTFSPEEQKTLRRFSTWEMAELIFRVNVSTLRGRLALDPTLPEGEVEQEGRQRWYTLDEVNEIRRRVKVSGKSLMRARPAGKRAVRAAVANFKGGAGKSTTALHFAHAAALDGYRVLCVDFDPQATLSHSMGVHDVAEENTVWGVMVRDLINETNAMNAATTGAVSGETVPGRGLPASIIETEMDRMRSGDFIVPTCWSTIDLVPSCANAAFVEFASAQYRHISPEWSFYGAVSRFLDALPDDEYDVIIFDCPPAIGYQSMNAVFAADVLYVPSGPGFWEYDSTTSFLGQLGEALGDLPEAKEFADVRFLLTRFEPANPLHIAMQEGFEQVFGQRVTENPIEMTRAVEQSGRFLSSIYEVDYRDMTRETWRRARGSFDRAYDDFHETLINAWSDL